MTQLITRMVMNDEYQYISLPNTFTQDEISHYSKWIYNRFHKLSNKKLNIKLNSEWITRHYLACKMIYAASVMVSSLKYAIDKNLKMCVPYLSYYSILTCCRAVVFTLPDEEWSESGLIEINHSKAANVVKNAYMKFNKDYAKVVYNKINLYREYRELFSYRFPASGIDALDINIAFEDTVDFCKELCEIAQLNSSQIESYIRKNCSGDIERDWGKLDRSFIERTFIYSKDKIGLVDREDWYRIDYIERKQPFPVSLYLTMTEGMTEDFFGAWAVEDNEFAYNPDIDWNIIFQVP